jgi:hypothetical protein
MSDRESPLHEAANLVALPIMSCLALLGLTSVLDPLVATLACTL